MATFAAEPPSLIAVKGRRRGATYHPQVDGLRALAIMGVLSEHFSLVLPDLLRCGPLSVRFFFVLSGYFVTLSLWKVRDETEHTRGNLFLPVMRYFLQRFLRIGPPFYLALAVGLLLGIEEVRVNLFWLATFQANNYIAWLGHWPDAVSHFWSLAVQEQFYLVWPILILTVPHRWFLPLMASLVVGGLLFRLGCIATGTSELVRWLTLFGCLDSFAVGALVAFLREAGWLDQVRLLPRTVRFAMPLAAFACFFLGRALMTLPPTNLFLGLAESVDAVFLVWLLSMALLGCTGRYGRALTWPPLVYLGRISYGIYVYHVFVIVIFSPLLVRMGLTTAHFALGRIAVLTALTMALASLSWHGMEQPLLAWRNAKASVRKRRAAVPEFGPLSSAAS